MKRQTKFTSWSFSRLQDFRQCPLKAKLKHLDKIKEPPNEAMERGTKIHKLAEDYIKGTISKLPIELARFKDEFAMLRKAYKKKILGAKVEGDGNFTKDWLPTTWDDWANCWVRVKIDATHYLEGNVLMVTDWKTGKFRRTEVQDYLEQLELYCLTVLILDTSLAGAVSRLVYLDEGTIYPPKEEQIVVMRKDIARLQKKWAKVVAPMMNAVNFPAKPNDKCHWCHYRKSNASNGGGQCKF